MRAAAAAALLCVLCLALLPLAAAVPPADFACLACALAYNFSLALQPFRGPAYALTLADALNATSCGGFAPPPPSPPAAAAPAAPAPPPAALRVLVDPSGALPGSVPTVAAAVASLRRQRRALPHPVAATIELAPGAHRVGARGLQLTAEDSFTALVGAAPAAGGAPGPAAWLTGAEPLPTSIAWQPYNLSGGANVWAADVGAWLGGLELVGLRVAGARATRCRYPNADPERDGFGSALRAEAWLPPAALGSAVQFAPPLPSRSVTGNYTGFALGVGGACAVFSPPASLWCSTGRTQSGGDAPFQLPTGLVASPAVLPHSPYASPATAVVHAFRPSRWENYMWQVNGSSSAQPGALTFGAGGFQGARGCAAGEAFFVENVVEELDAPGEWHYSPATGQLLLWHNASSGTPPPPATPGLPGTGVEAPLARVLLNLTGTAAAPVRNVSLLGLGFRDSRYTYLDPHGVPSGGDWALARSAALYAEGTVGLAVEGCAFWRLDGNGLLAYGFHRGLRVARNEFAWLGGSAVALWGRTTGAGAVGVPEDGPDGTAMEQPWGTAVDSNLFRELGIYQKQSAAVFQAKAGASAVTRNVAFNLPRAAFLLNDGLGGGSVVHGNAAFNTCRESGPPADHGPVNLWDRVAYTWLDGAGQPTSTKQTDAVTRNLLLGNYFTSTAVDSDDGTRFLNVTDNVLVGGTLGAKQPFGGARLLFARNLHAFVGLGYHLYHPPDAGWAFVNATLVQGSDGSYGVNTVCSGAGQTTLGGSVVATPRGNVTECGQPLVAWQAASGMDRGSVAAQWPGYGELVGQAWERLAPVLQGQ